MAGQFDDLFDLDGAFGRRSHPGQPAAKPQPLERGVQISGRDIDGTYYVRLDHVVELLAINGVLPKATARFQTFLKGRA